MALNKHNKSKGQTPLQLNLSAVKSDFPMPTVLITYPGRTNRYSINTNWFLTPWEINLSDSIAVVLSEGAQYTVTPWA